MEVGAAIVGFAGLSIQMVDSARKLFVLYENTKDAPRRLDQAATSLQLLGEILGSLPTDEPSEDASGSSSLLGRCKAECDKSVTRINALVDRLATRIVLRPRVGKLYAALKGDEMTAVLDELEFEKSNLSLAFDMFRYHEQRRNAVHLEQILQQLAIMQIPSNPKTTAVTSLALDSSTEVDPTAVAVRSSSSEQHCIDKRRFLTRVALPFIRNWKILHLAVTQSCGGFDFKLRTQTLRPESAEIFALARAGDLSGMKELIRAGQASLLDTYYESFEYTWDFGVTPMETVLGDAAKAGHVELCCWILEQESWYLSDEKVLLRALRSLMQQCPHTSLTFLLQLANLEVDLFPESCAWLYWWPDCPIQAQSRAWALFHEAYQFLDWTARGNIVALSRAFRDASETETSESEHASVMNVLEGLIPVHLDRLHPALHEMLLHEIADAYFSSYRDSSILSRQTMAVSAVEILRASLDPLQAVGVAWDSQHSVFYYKIWQRISRSPASIFGVLADDITEFIKWWKEIIKNAGIDMSSYMEAEASAWSRARPLVLPSRRKTSRVWGIPWNLHYDPETDECAVEVKPTIIVPVYRRINLPGTFHATDFVPAEICWEPKLTEEDWHEWHWQRDIDIDAQTVTLREEKASSYLEDWPNYAQDDAREVMLRRDLGTHRNQRRSRSQPCPMDRDRVVRIQNTRFGWMPSFHRGVYSSRLCFHHQEQSTFDTEFYPERRQTAEMLHDCASGKHMESRFIWNPGHPDSWLSSVLLC